MYQNLKENCSTQREKCAYNNEKSIALHFDSFLRWGDRFDPIVNKCRVQNDDDYYCSLLFILAEHASYALI